MQSAKWLTKKLAVFGSSPVSPASFIAPTISYAVVDPGGGTSTPTYYYSQMTPDQQALSYALYYGVLQCFSGSGGFTSGINSVSNDDVIRGSISAPGNLDMQSFYADTVYGDGGDGKISCETAIGAGIALWQYGDLGTALLAWGFTNPGNGGDWTNDNPGTDIGAALRARIYARQQPQLGGPGKYLTYRAALEKGCQISNPVSYDSAGAALKSAADKTSGAADYVKVTEPTADLQARRS